MAIKHSNSYCNPALNISGINLTTRLSDSEYQNGSSCPDNANNPEYILPNGSNNAPPEYAPVGVGDYWVKKRHFIIAVGVIGLILLIMFIMAIAGIVYLSGKIKDENDKKEEPKTSQQTGNSPNFGREINNLKRQVANLTETQNSLKTLSPRVGDNERGISQLMSDVKANKDRLENKITEDYKQEVNNLKSQFGNITEAQNALKNKQQELENTLQTHIGASTAENEIANLRNRIETINSTLMKQKSSLIILQTELDGVKINMTDQGTDAPSSVDSGSQTEDNDSLSAIQISQKFGELETQYTNLDGRITGLDWRVGFNEGNTSQLKLDVKANKDRLNDQGQQLTIFETKVDELQGTVESEILADAGISNPDDYITDDGWIMIQRRKTLDVSFNQNFATYEDGFGDPAGDFWFGLANMHTLTSAKNYKLRITVVTSGGVTLTGKFNGFVVLGSSDQYKITLGSQIQTSFPYDLSLNELNDKIFATGDKNDNVFGCANSAEGGWWQGTCGRLNLNAKTGSCPMCMRYDSGAYPVESSMAMKLLP